MYFLKPAGLQYSGLIKRAPNISTVIPCLLSDGRSVFGYDKDPRLFRIKRNSKAVTLATLPNHVAE